MITVYIIKSCISQKQCSTSKLTEASTPPELDRICQHGFAEVSKSYKWGRATLQISTKKTSAYPINFCFILQW